MATKKEDVRITKTKAALSKAFFNLLMEKSYEHITVNELCERADVRRATFYKHFEDKADFTIHLIKETRARFDKTADSNTTIEGIKEYYLYCSEAIINYLLKYEHAIRKIMNSDMRPTFIELFARQNREDTVRRLEKSRLSGATFFLPPDVLASTLIGGAAHCIVDWYEKDDRCPTDELLGNIAMFIDRLLS